jgi:hypothetical protein
MPDVTDRFEGDHCFIVTNPSQGNFHLYGTDPEEIHIGDIANALSKQCRFTGHLVEDAWYSVAEHSCDVANIIKQMGGSKAEQFAGLMHDTPEAFLSDICAPFKREIGQYYEKEALIWARIAPKFGLPLKLPDIVKAADWRALFIEASTFVIPFRLDILKTWIGYAEHGDAALSMNYPMVGMDHRTARNYFLATFSILKGAVLATT